MSATDELSSPVKSFFLLLIINTVFEFFQHLCLFKIRKGVCPELCSRVMNHHLDSSLQKKIIHYTNDDLYCTLFIVALSFSDHE
jgi:hypothetical protein